jgi:hypothetical protein
MPQPRSNAATTPKSQSRRGSNVVRTLLRAWQILATTVFVLVFTAHAALADVTVTPTAPPGVDGLQDLLNWTMYGGALACTGTMIYGFAKMGLSHQSQSYSGANHGKAVAMLGLVGALGLGLTPTIVNGLTAIH